MRWRLERGEAEEQARQNSKCSPNFRSLVKASTAYDVPLSSYFMFCPLVALCWCHRCAPLAAAATRMEGGGELQIAGQKLELEKSCQATPP